MQDENGIVRKPIGLHEMKRILGTINADTGVICTSGNINYLAKYKPVKHSTEGAISEQERKVISYGTYVPALNLVTVGGKSIIEDGSPWFADLPRGKEHNEPFRVMDFEGYVHSGIGKDPLQWNIGNVDHKQVVPIDWRNTDSVSFAIYLEGVNDNVTLRDVLYKSTASGGPSFDAYDSLYIWVGIVCLDGKTQYYKRSDKTVGQLISQGSSIGALTTITVNKSDFPNMTVYGEYKIQIFVGSITSGGTMLVTENPANIYNKQSLNYGGGEDCVKLNYTYLPWDTNLKAAPMSPVPTPVRSGNQCTFNSNIILGYMRYPYLSDFYEEKFETQVDMIIGTSGGTSYTKTVLNAKTISVLFTESPQPHSETLTVTGQVYPFVGTAGSIVFQVKGRSVGSTEWKQISTFAWNWNNSKGVFEYQAV